MGAELVEAFTAVDADPAVRVAVLTGAGDRAFCAGADMDFFAGQIAKGDGGGSRIVGSLMGAVDINNLGEVVFGVQFTSASGGGNAIYVAYVPEPAAASLIVMLLSTAGLRRQRRS